MRAFPSLRPILALIGFTAVIAQIVLMRELIVVFYGNEISLGLILANWLLWTAFGSSILGRLAARVHKPHVLVAGLQALIAAAFPCTIYVARVSKTVFHPTPGEILGPGPVFLTSLVVLSLFCAISGFLFAAGSRLYADRFGTSTVAGTSSVYLLEAVGSGIGGILASLVLIRYLTAFEIAALVALFNLLAAASLGIPRLSYRRATLGALFGVFVFLVFPFGARWLEAMSVIRVWSGLHLVATRNSVYGNLAVVEAGGSRTLFENGVAVFSAPNPAAAEEAVHYALLEHPAPGSLLLIGGGVNGSLAQALQYSSLERVDYVELDPMIFEIARDYFSKEWEPVRKDPRVHVHNVDGRLYLKTTPQTFDVVIVNLPEPQTAQLNRFYTFDFFQEAAAKLNPGGILSFQLQASENYTSPELAKFLQCIHKTLLAVFPEVTAIPGDTVHFFAAKSAGTLTSDPQVLLARLRQRRIETTYVREYYIPFRMSPDRMSDLAQQIRPRADSPINRDFAPIAYYFDVALWSSRFNAAYRSMFQSIAGVSFERVATAAGALLFLLAAFLRWLPAREHRPKVTAGVCVAAMGFTLIGLEIVLLLGFQAIYGYVYHQLAIVIASFMVGMALGTWWELRSAVEAEAKPIRRRHMWALASLQFLAAVSPLALWALFDPLTLVRSPAALFAVSHGLFPILALLSGLLGGKQFPLASRIFFSGSGEGAGSPGTLYALDLLGACVGAVLLSAYLIPVFGFLRTALLMAVVNLAPTVLAVLSASETRALRE